MTADDPFIDAEYQAMQEASALNAQEHDDDDAEDIFTRSEPHVQESYRTVANAWDDIDCRVHGLREAIAFFAYVRRGDKEPPRATVVMQMAQHFADWIETGELPDTNGGDE